MNWQQILVSAVITLILSGILIPISTKIISRKMTQYFDKKDEAVKEAKEKKEKEDQEARINAEKVKEQEKKEQNARLLEQVDAIVKKHTDPIDSELQKVEEDLGKVKNGTVDALRDRILSTYYKCLEKRFYTQYEYENIHHMYDDYVDLHGNSFVEKCLKDFDELDSEEKVRAKRKRKAVPAKSQQRKKEEQ